jgi:hypothetical protein
MKMLFRRRFKNENVVQGGDSKMLECRAKF